MTAQWSPSESSQVARWESQYFPHGVNAAEETLIQDEASAQEARQGAGGPNPFGGGLGGWIGFHLPRGLSPDDLTAALNIAQAFAAASGWRYFPNARNIIDMAMRPGITQAQAFMGMYETLPVSAQRRMPWLEFGLNPQQYTDQTRSYNEAANSLLGVDYGASGLDPGVLRNAFLNNWSLSRFEQAIQNDPTAKSKYGWLSHGLNYQQFNQYMVDNKRNLEQRYGTGNVNAKTALNDLNNPLQSFGSYAPPIQTATPKESPSTGYGLSSVR